MFHETSQRGLVDLHHDGTRERVQHVQLVRRLVIRQRFPNPKTHRFERKSWGSRLQHNERDANLANDRRGATHHGGIVNVFMLPETPLYFDWVNIVSTSDVHFADAPGKADVSPLIHPAEIPGIQPSALTEGFRSPFGIAPIAAHHPRRAQADAAYLTQR